MTLLRPRARAGGGGSALRALLEADRFRLGPGTARVLQNLALHGGVGDDRALAWVGDDLPPHGAPSVTLGEARGTLGPWSFGFLDNRRGVAALAAPLPVRPPVGPLALVAGRREALPDVGPLCSARGLGISFILSVGDGDAAETLAFLGEDAGTSAVLLGTPRVSPAALLGLAGKPAVLLGGDPLLRAAVRRGGGAATDDLEEWLAAGSLLGSGVPRPREPRAVVVGAGLALATSALRAAGATLPVVSVPDDDPDEVMALLAEAATGADLLLVVGSAPLPQPAHTAAILVDIGFPDRLRALARALSLLPASTTPSPAAPAEVAQARAILAEAGDVLGDHDTKRLLKSHGARVSRQGPANSATAALRIAEKVGLPVDIVAARPQSRDPLAETVRRATTIAEVRRAAAVLLDQGLPFVLVREAFSSAGRARLSVRRDKALGAYAAVGEERALLPLEGGDARLLARAATSGEPSEALVSLLARCAACAHQHQLTLEVELATDAAAVVVAAAERAPG